MKYNYKQKFVNRKIIEHFDAEENVVISSFKNKLHKIGTCANYK
jgi:hypothetical protein